MFKERKFQSSDESFILSVMTNQFWSSIKGKKPQKQFIRNNLKRQFYNYLYDERLSIKVICLDDNETVIIGFYVVLDDCLITIHIKSDFKVIDEIREQLIKLLSVNVEYCYLLQCLDYFPNLKVNAFYWGIL